MPAAISPTAASRCCMRASRSSLLMSVTSWNVNEVAGAAARRLAGASRSGRSRSSRPSAGRIRELDAPRAGAARAVVRARRRSAGGSCSTSPIGRPTTDAARTPVIASAARLNVRIRCRAIGRRQAARQAVDDVLVERLQVGDLGRRLLEPRAGRPQAVRPASRSSSATAKNPNTFSATVYCATDRGGSDAAHARQPRIVQQPGAAEVLRQHQADVEHRAQRRHQQAAAPELHRAAGDDRQHVERREVAGDAAGEVDERRDDAARRSASCRSTSQRCRST